MDPEGVGYIDRPMLRTYTQRILDAVNPDAPFDEDGFEQGFQVLDHDQDGKITLSDLIWFTCSKREQSGEQVPSNFQKYCAQSNNQ